MMSLAPQSQWGGGGLFDILDRINIALFWGKGVVFCFGLVFFGYLLGQKKGRERISQRMWKIRPRQTNKQLMRLIWDEGTEEGYT